MDVVLPVLEEDLAAAEVEGLGVSCRFGFGVVVCCRVGGACTISL